MALLDQMLIEGVRRNAPEIKPWNAGRFMTNVGQFVNTNERINELQRQNSLRNLIAQREQDGVPFDRLSNEAAKYDMAKALSMRGEARDSIKFNRTESEAELANHKKTMAGWLGGLVLRRAQEAVASGDAQWDFDYVVNVCNEAAAAIYPYDPTAATALLNFGKQGLAKKSTAAEKKRGDETSQLNSNKKRYLQIVADSQKDPIKARKNNILADIDQKILDWKRNGEFDPNLYGHNSGYQRSIYVPMESGLYAELEKMFPKMTTDPGVYKVASSYLQKMDDNELSRILGVITDERPEEKPEEKTETEPPKTPSTVKKSTSENTSVPVNEGSVKLPKSLIYNDEFGAKTFDPEAAASLDTAIPYLISDNDFKQAFKLAEQLPHAESGESMAYNETKKAIRDQQKVVKELRGGKKVSDGFVRAMMNKVANSGRTATAFNAQMTALASFVTGAETTRSSLTLINNGLLALLPFYKPTDYDAKAALSTIHNDSTWDDVKTVIAGLNLPIFSEGARLMNMDSAIDALIDDVNQKYQNYGETLVQEAGSDEERKQIMADLDKRWAFREKGMNFLFKNRPILSGEERLKTIEENAKLQKKASKEEYERRKREGEQPSIYSSTDKGTETKATYTKESWDNF